MQAIATPSSPSGAEVVNVAAGLRQRAPSESQESLYDFSAMLEEGARSDAPGAENDLPIEAGARKQPDKELRSCEEGRQESTEDENIVVEQGLDGAQDDETTAAEEVELTPSEDGQGQEAEQDGNGGVEQNETSAVDGAARTSEGDGVVNQTDGRGAVVEDATANRTEAPPAAVGATVSTGDVQRENTAPESPAPSNPSTGEGSRLTESAPDGKGAPIEAKGNKESAGPPDGTSEAVSRQAQAGENPSREDAIADEVRRPAENAALGERPAAVSTRTDVQREDGDAEAELTSALRRTEVAPEESESPQAELTPNGGDSAQRFAYGRTQNPFGERVASLARQGQQTVEHPPSAVDSPLGATVPHFGPAATGVGKGSLNAPRFIEGMVRQAQLINRPDGSAEIRLRLEPPELGSVLVRLSLRNDRLYAELEVDNPAAREMVGGTLQRLREALSGEGIDLEKFDIGLRRQPSREPDREARQQSSQRGDGFGSDTAAEPEGAPRGIHVLRAASLSAAGMIDFVA